MDYGTFVSRLPASMPEDQRRALADSFRDVVKIGLRPKTTPRRTTTGTTVLSDKGCRVAITAGITIPANVYAAGDWLELYNDSASPVVVTQGASLTMRLDATTVTGNRLLPSRGVVRIWFNSPTDAVYSAIYGAYADVRAYGAIGDGVADDTAAIQAAITAAGVSRSVYIPSGRYNITSAIAIPGQCTVYGDGATSILQTANNIAIFDIDLSVTGDIYYSSYRDFCFLSTNAGSSVAGFYVHGTTTNVFHYNRFQNLLAVGMYRVFRVEKNTNVAGEMGFDWNSFLDCKCTNNGAVQTQAFFYSLYGSGTGNIFANHNLVCSGNHIEYVGTGACNVGDLLFSNIHFGGGSLTCIKLPVAAGYRHNIAISGCQFDAGITLGVTADSYDAIRVLGCNFGGASTQNLVALTNCTNVLVDGHGAALQQYANVKTGTGIAAVTNFFSLTMAANQNALVEIITQGYLQGRGASITRSTYTIVLNGTTPTATQKSNDTDGVGGAVLTHTTTTAAGVVTFVVTTNSTIANSDLYSNIYLKSFNGQIACL